MDARVKESKREEARVSRDERQGKKGEKQVEDWHQKEREVYDRVIEHVQV